jgi:hypothetical protein
VAVVVDIGAVVVVVTTSAQVVVLDTYIQHL